MLDERGQHVEPSGVLRSQSRLMLEIDGDLLEGPIIVRLRLDRSDIHHTTSGLILS